MKIVIDIPEDSYKATCDGCMLPPDVENVVQGIKNGTPLPKGHGRLIDADKCIKQALNDFYKHEDECKKKDTDYVGSKRFYDQTGFLCCLKTIGDSPTVIDADKIENDVPNFESKEYIKQRLENYNNLLEGKTGKWIDGKCNRCGTNAPFWAMATTYYCSEYCPKCGAKMEAEDAETER